MPSLSQTARSEQCQYVIPRHEKPRISNSAQRCGRKQGGCGALLDAPGDAAVIERGHPRFPIMRCPCGCGADLLANLDRRAGSAWRLYRERGRLTLFPSYWRDTACDSHFIISSERLFWCDTFDDSDDDGWPLEVC